MILRRPLFVGSAVGLLFSQRGLAQLRVGLWFDPTRLPSYTGRLERWIATPAGTEERGLLREGTQFVFPASEAEALAAAIENGAPICVWGIRARTAAVVMILAWERTENDPATFVERPAWFPVLTPGRERLTLSGRILAALLSPQGEPMGMILTEPSRAICLPIAVHAALGDALRPEPRSRPRAWARASAASKPLMRAAWARTPPAFSRSRHAGVVGSG